jgi:hypothetical protein
MDDCPNPGEIEEPGTRLGRFSPSGLKKECRCLVEFVAGDALRREFLPLWRLTSVSPPSLVSLPDLLADLSSSRRRRPWWPAMNGRGVWLFVVVVFLLFSSPPANNQAVGSRFTTVLLSPLFVRGSEVVGWSKVCGDSYAGTSRPDPWRRAASAMVAPTLSPFFFSNKSFR